jgi:GDP-L-fucose synthase
MVGGENPMKVWGDGSVIRDFIFSQDVAGAMIQALEEAPPCVPINIGSGTGFTIKEIAETIGKHVPVTPEIGWDPSKPSGDPVRILSMKRAKELLGFKAPTSLSDGIRTTVEWYVEYLSKNPTAEVR